MKRAPDPVLRYLDILVFFALVTCAVCIAVWTAGALVLFLWDREAAGDAVGILGWLYVITAIIIPLAIPGIERLTGGKL